MRLQVSVWAEDLPNASMVGTPDPFAVLTALPSPPNNNNNNTNNNNHKPVVLGRTETLRNTTSPDWTKFFYVENYQLGQPCTVIVSIYDDRENKDDNSDTTGHPMGSTLFELGAVLGTEGSICGKELKGGRGIVVLQVERASSSGRGILHFQLRGHELLNREGFGVFRKSDPFFELQRLRRSIRTGARVWDCVYRSRPVTNDLNPLWDDAYLEVEALIGAHESTKHQTFRIAVYDHNAKGNHKFMGDVLCTLDKWIWAGQGNSNGTGTGNAVNTDRAFTLKASGKDVGCIVVWVANVTMDAAASSSPTKAPHVESSVEVTDAQHQNTIVTEVDEPEIVVEVASASEELAPEGDDIVAVEPTFVNYVSGGCQLHVLVAIDATASNGDPRQSTSLHHFNNQGRNEYEEALFALCTILSKYDTDQQYPVFGFGAKRNGVLSQCFPLGPTPLANGVNGILHAYRTAFRSGIVMTSPRDFAEVIDAAAADAQSELSKGQAYSILLLFTNGIPADLSKTETALQRAADAPLSIVLVGIGPNDFSALQRLSGIGRGGNSSRRDHVRFVPYDTAHKTAPHQLSGAALDPIPAQLETYFAAHDIWPHPAVAANEIVVHPYQESDDVYVPLHLSPSTGGVPTVTGQVIVPEATAVAVVPMPPPASPNSPGTAGSSASASASAAAAPSSPSGKRPSNSKLDEAKGYGKKIMNSRIGKQAYGRLKGQARAKIRHFAKQTLGFSPI